MYSGISSHSHRERSGYVDCQQVGSIDRNLFSSKLIKATHFETMITTVDEVNSDKTKVPEEFIFRSILPNSMSKLIHNLCKLTYKLFVKTI